MKIKKIIFTTLLLLFTVSSFKVPLKAKAQEIKFYRILNDSAYIYSDSNFTDKIFIVPYSYYVKIEEEKENYLKVSYGDYNDNYPQIIGYMRKNEVNITENLPVNPYYISKVSTKSTDILFSDYNLSKPFFNVSKDSLLTFYGEYITENNEILCYCYYNNKLGYINKNSLYNYSIPINSDPILEGNTPPNDIVNDNSNGEYSSVFLMNENLQIIIIVGISIVCISVVYALFKPTKNKVYSKSSDVFDEGE